MTLALNLVSTITPDGYEAATDNVPNPNGFRIEITKIQPVVNGVPKGFFPATGMSLGGGQVRVRATITSAAEEYNFNELWIYDGISDAIFCKVRRVDEGNLDFVSPYKKSVINYNIKFTTLPANTVTIVADDGQSLALAELDAHIIADDHVSFNADQSPTPTQVNQALSNLGLSDVFDAKKEIDNVVNGLNSASVTEDHVQLFNVLSEKFTTVKAESLPTNTDFNAVFGAVNTYSTYKVTNQTIANSLVNAPDLLPGQLQVHVLNNNHILQKYTTMYTDMVYTRHWNRGYIDAVDRDAAALGDSRGWSKCWVQGVVKGGDDPITVKSWGQSNCVGVRSGGPNPASTLVKTWNAVAGAWGGSDINAAPWTLPAPDGNGGGNNNIALAFCHRLAEETGRKVYLIHDAVSGQSIDEWVANGRDSARFAAARAKVAAAFATPELQGCTRVDYVINVQGEEDALTHSGAQYQSKLEQWDVQMRAEDWADSETLHLIVGASSLHDRYAVASARRKFCADRPVNRKYVSTKGMLTDNEVLQGSGDQTHFIGQDLWRIGYYNAYLSLTALDLPYSQSPFYSRGAGVFDGNVISGVAISSFDALVSSGSATSNAPFNGPAAQHALMFGYQVAGGNFGSVFGYKNSAVGALYYGCFGRDNVIATGKSYSFSAGYRSTINANKAAAFGEGHVVSDDWQLAVGRWSKFRTVNADPVAFQVGIGTSASVAKNAATFFQSGKTELGGNVYFAVDNAYSVGEPSFRASVIYAGTGAISTSDGTLKTVRGALTDAEIRAWAKVNWCVYQFNDAIAEKGDAARLHAGAIAQEVAAAFESEGLDVRKYALFCEDDIFETVVEEVAVTRERQQTRKVVKSEQRLDGAELIVEQVESDELVFVKTAVQTRNEAGDLIDVLDDAGNVLFVDLAAMETYDDVDYVRRQVAVGKRMGLRYEQCLVFECAYLRSKVAML